MLQSVDIQPPPANSRYNLLFKVTFKSSFQFVCPTVAGAAAATMHRQMAAAPKQATATATGVSAFAFQGTNAHVLLQTGIAAVIEAEKASPMWQYSRIWYAPAPHKLVEAALKCNAAAAEFVARLSRPSLAYMWHHKVRYRPET